MKCTYITYVLVRDKKKWTYEHIFACAGLCGCQYNDCLDLNVIYSIYIYISCVLFFQKIKINLTYEIIRPTDPNTARADSDLLQVSLETIMVPWQKPLSAPHVNSSLLEKNYDHDVSCIKKSNSYICIYMIW